MNNNFVADSIVPITEPDYYAEAHNVGAHIDGGFPAVGTEAWYNTVRKQHEATMAPLRKMNEKIEARRGIQSLSTDAIADLMNNSDPTDMSYLFKWYSGLKTLNLSWFNTSEVEKMVQMFNRCLTLKALDISSFDTSKVNDMREMFGGCNMLSAVRLGPKFSFKGAGIQDKKNQAILPTPPAWRHKENLTGKWIREDGTYGPFSAQELRDNYRPEMAGLWVLERK